MNKQLNINFDLSEIVRDYSISDNEVNNLMEAVLTDVSFRIISEWRGLANDGLRTSRSEYVRGIQLPEIQGNTSTISLIGTLPNMLEQGASPFDMKEGFRNSSRVKFSKDGKSWYMSIPFRWGTPGTVSFANVMEPEVYDLMLGKEAFNRDAGQKGETLKESELPLGLQGRLTRSKIVFGEKVYGAYKHKSNIRDAMRREQKTYERATQSQYVTFRRVSSNSDPLSWIHKGLAARNFADQAVNSFSIDDSVAVSVDNFITGMGL